MEAFSLVSGIHYDKLIDFNDKKVLDDVVVSMTA
jgi:hypothetical protein